MTHVRQPLVIGAEGQIGQAVLAALPAAAGTTRRTPAVPGGWRVDLAAPAAEWQLPHHVSEAYLCAGITAQDTCRQQPAATWWINVTQTAALAQVLIDRGAFVVFISTNLVFDGRQPRPGVDDPLCPVTEYGRQKAAAEQELLRLGPAVAIVRVTKIVTPRLPLFQRWRSALAARMVIQPFTDLMLAPLPLSAVVPALIQVAVGRQGGRVHLSGERDLSYAAAALALARHVGADPDLIQPTTSVQSGLQLEAVPQHTTLDDTLARRQYAWQPPSAEAALLEGFGNPV